MMVALLLYAYAKGELSSRGIERACVEDVAFSRSPACSATCSLCVLTRAWQLREVVRFETLEPCPIPSEPRQLERE